MNYLQFFSNLTNLLERIGKLAPIIDRFKKVFDRSDDLKQAVAEFWAIVISILHKAFGFLRKKGEIHCCSYIIIPGLNHVQSVAEFRKLLWLGYGRFFSAIISPFNAQFQDLEDSLRSQKQYIMDLVKVTSEEANHAMRQQLIFDSEQWELQRGFETQGTYMPYSRVDVHMRGQCLGIAKFAI